MDRLTKGTVAVTAALALATAMALPAWAGAGRLAAAAQEAHEGPLGLRGPLVQCLRETLEKLRALGQDLQLTAEQKAEIAKILKGRREEIISVIRDVHAKRKALMQAVRADTVDEAAIRAAGGKLGSSIGDAAVLRATIRGEVRKVLTDEQRRKMDASAADIEKSVDAAVADIGK